MSDKEYYNQLLKIIFLSCFGFIILFSIAMIFISRYIYIKNVKLNSISGTETKKEEIFNDSESIISESENKSYSYDSKKIKLVDN